MTNFPLDELIDLQKQPAVFTAGELEFWTDPYIAKQMLKTHLDPNVDLASRRPETIQRTVAWILKMTGLKVGDALLDLGCGPGLYAERFAQSFAV